jgi:LysM repeat protein
MRLAWRYYKIAKGDTLASIARQNHTSTGALVSANNLEPGATLQFDSRLIVPIAPARAVTANVVGSRKLLRYRVRKGDTVASIADDFGVSPEKLRRWNHIQGNALRPGRILIIRPMSADSEPVRAKEGGSHSRTTAGKSNSGRNLDASRRAVHTVKAGETLYSIAAEYKTTVGKLQRENKLASATIHPGDTLVVHEVR